MRYDGRTSNAFHEAGHVVVGGTVNWRVQSVTLDPPRTTFASMPGDRWAQIRVLLAGVDAEARYFGNPRATAGRNRRVLDALAAGDLTSLGDGDDLEIAKLLAGLTPQAAAVELAKADADTHAVLDRNWSSVEKLAGQLLASAPLLVPADRPVRTSDPVLRARIQVGMIAAAVGLVILLAHL